MTLAMLGIAVYALAIAALSLSRNHVAAFLRRHPVINDADSLEAFKKLARRNMKAVFPLVALFFLGLTLTAQLIIHHRVTGFVALLFLNGFVVWSALAANKVEKLARELPCPDPVLALEYRRIAEAWLNDFWPRF